MHFFRSKINSIIWAILWAVIYKPLGNIFRCRCVHCKNGKFRCGSCRSYLINSKHNDAIGGMYFTCLNCNATLNFGDSVSTLTGLHPFHIINYNELEIHTKIPRYPEGSVRIKNTRNNSETEIDYFDFVKFISLSEAKKGEYLNKVKLLG